MRRLLTSENGYLYHPSPASPVLGDSYGPYSLVSSTAVLQRLAEGLEVYDDTGPVRADGRHEAGTVAWAGTKYSLGLLRVGIDA